MQPDSHTIWDPGIDNQDPNERRKLFKINVPSQLYTLIATASGVEDENGNTTHDEIENSRTELDSHANMPVVG